MLRWCREGPAPNLRASAIRLGVSFWFSWKRHSFFEDEALLCFAVRNFRETAKIINHVIVAVFFHGDERAMIVQAILGRRIPRSACLSLGHPASKLLATNLSVIKASSLGPSRVLIHLCPAFKELGSDASRTLLGVYTGACCDRTGLMQDFREQRLENPRPHVTSMSDFLPAIYPTTIRPVLFENVGSRGAPS